MTTNQICLLIISLDLTKLLVSFHFVVTMCQWVEYLEFGRTKNFVTVVFYSMKEMEPCMRLKDTGNGINKHLTMPSCPVGLVEKSDIVWLKPSDIIKLNSRGRIRPVFMKTFKKLLDIEKYGGGNEFNVIKTN